ncbi:MAG: hypothetical protein HCA25_02305 [Dolichospermum sp. DET50]|nr:hypothetical protein [Dolichospermum sp. DET66]MBS3031141.1 hypothetical protein [Dolichospermum sp. DET67]MBS3036351.1 hypothetical protein [Dolichospermum sp. DET50]QSX68411.1 MAG: hypothetical protein EZY12_01475 [Dolichospermum sp. DET69]
MKLSNFPRQSAFIVPFQRHNLLVISCQLLVVSCQLSVENIFSLPSAPFSCASSVPSPSMWEDNQ